MSKKPKKQPYQPHLADQLSSAYDTYLEIQCKVKQWQYHALSQDPHWDQMHVCVPCLYKVDDEPVMKFSLLGAMDGNNSLKLIDSTFHPGTSRTDSRTSESTRWISSEEVDMFRNEVGKIHLTLSYIC